MMVSEIPPHSQEGLTEEMVELAAGLRGHALQMQQNLAESARTLDSIEARRKRDCTVAPLLSLSSLAEIYTA